MTTYKDLPPNSVVAALGGEYELSTGLADWLRDYHKKQQGDFDYLVIVPEYLEHLVAQGIATKIGSTYYAATHKEVNHG